MKEKILTQPLLEDWAVQSAANQSPKQNVLPPGATENLAAGRRKRKKIPTGDLSGQRFVRLSVKDFAGPVNGHLSWNCVCDCGKHLVVRATALRDNGSKSCGCFRRDNTRERSTTHGRFKTYTWNRWHSMLYRCSAGATGKCRKNYFERGIRVCERWRSFENFLADMGEAPAGMTVDRKDNSGNYEPDNCRWATRFEQDRNRTNTLNLTHNGKTQCAADWARELGIQYATLLYRVKVGMSEGRMFAPSPRFRKP